MSEEAGQTGFYSSRTGAALPIERARRRVTNRAGPAPCYQSHGHGNRVGLYTEKDIYIALIQLGETYTIGYTTNPIEYDMYHRV